VALERALLDDARTPITVLRPAAIHGPGSRHPREWFFVKRIVDGRRAVPLAWEGRSRFHSSATANIAELIRVVLAAPATGILNIGDPEVLTVQEIGTAIGVVYGHDWRLVPVVGPGPRGVGANPWATPFPLELDLSRAQSLGYRPVTTYAAAAESTCRSAEVMASAGVAFPDYILKLFDYAAEDAWLAARG
jgi:nucleoside-diphosphate-sugar epimerase